MAPKRRLAQRSGRPHRNHSLKSPSRIVTPAALLSSLSSSGGGSGNPRVINAQAVICVGFPQVADNPPAKDIHGVLFQSAACFFRQNDHHLGAVGFPQPLYQHLADAVGAEILVFDINGSPGGGDTVQIEPLHFPNGLLTLLRGECSGHSYPDPAEIRNKAGGPGGIHLDVNRFNRFRRDRFFPPARTHRFLANSPSVPAAGPATAI